MCLVELLPCALQVWVDCVAFPPAPRNELQSDPSGLSLTLVLVAEGLQDSGQQKHTQALVPFTSKHQDRILSLVIKTGSFLQAWTMPSFITLTVGRVGLLCASTPHPLLERASVTGQEWEGCASAVFCPKEASGEWALPLETNGFRGAHAFFPSTWPSDVSAGVKLSLRLMKFLSE